MTMTHDERAEAVWNMLGHAIDGDSESAALSLMSIGQRSTTAEMFGVCCAIGEASAAVLRQMFPAMLWAPSQVMVGLRELQPGGLDVDPAGTWAARFLVAYANKDRDQTNALYDVALANGPDFFGDSVCALLAHFAGLGREQLRRKGITR